MGQEIERKFLVKRFPGEIVNEYKRTPIAQGYLNLDKERTVRVRQQGNRSYLTVKGITKGAARSEFEYEIPNRDAQDMILTMCKNLIVKERFFARVGSDLWEIDVFSGDNQGLIVAELEVNSEDYVINLPDWIGEEVTHDPRYFNSNLVTHPFKDWV